MMILYSAFETQGRAATDGPRRSTATRVDVRSGDRPQVVLRASFSIDGGIQRFRERIRAVRLRLVKEIFDALGVRKSLIRQSAALCQ